MTLSQTGLAQRFIHKLQSSEVSWFSCCVMSLIADWRGSVIVSVRRHDLLRLRWWNGANLQLFWPALCLHAAKTAPHRLWHRCRHWGQVRKSCGVTRCFLGSDPLQDQMHTIYRAFYLKWHDSLNLSWMFLVSSLYSNMSPHSHLFNTKKDARHPDAIAITYDPVSRWLSCVYNDHSLYVWDVRDVHRVGKVHSALFHAACVWDLEVNTCRRKWRYHTVDYWLGIIKKSIPKTTDYWLKLCLFLNLYSLAKCN